MRRVLMLAATLVIPVAGVAVAIGGGPAWAKAPKGPNGKMTCASANGTVTGNITIAGCVDSGSATATSSGSLSVTALATGGTVTWNNGKTSTFGAAAVTPTSAKHCPGYVKSTPKAPYTGPEPSADKFSGAVSADNSGLKVPGTFKGEVCISSAGTTITAAKPTKIT